MKFTFFWGGPFSQWYPSRFVVEDLEYNCAEQFMMAEKARLFADTARWRLILGSSSPREQKRLGRQVESFREDVWVRRAQEIVTRGNVAKFCQNEELKALLLSTDGTLVEANPYDCRWGIGLRSTDPRAKRRETWAGTNWLGFILTRIRCRLSR